MRRASALLAVALALLPLQPASAGDPGTVTGTVLMEAMTLTLSLDRDSVEAGKKAAATAVVRNLGSQKLTSVTATLQGASVVRMYPSPTRSTPSIKPYGSWTTRWDVCSMVPGNYVLLVSASGSYPEASFTTESTAALLTIRPGKAKGCP